MAFNWVFLKSETKFSCYEMKLYFSRLAWGSGIVRWRSGDRREGGQKSPNTASADWKGSLFGSSQKFCRLQNSA